MDRRTDILTDMKTVSLPPPTNCVCGGAQTQFGVERVGRHKQFVGSMTFKLFNMLGKMKISAHDISIYFFLFFPGRKDLTFHANCLL